MNTFKIALFIATTLALASYGCAASTEGGDQDPTVGESKAPTAGEVKVPVVTDTGSAPLNEGPCTVDECSIYGDYQTCTYTCPSGKIRVRQRY